MLKTSPIISPSASDSPTSFRRALPDTSSQEHATEASRHTTTSTASPDAPSPKSHPRPPGSQPSAASATPLSPSSAPSEPILSQRSWDALASASASASASVSASASASLSASTSSAIASVTASALVPIPASSSAPSTIPSTAAGHDASPRPDRSLPMTSATAGGAPLPPQTRSTSDPAQIPNDAPTTSPHKRRGHPSMHDIMANDTTTTATTTHDNPHDAAAAAATTVAQACAAPNRPCSPSHPSTPKRAKPDERAAKVLPSRYELCHVDDMVQLIAHMLGELIATNDAIRISNGGLTRFHSRTAPGISVRDYLHRLARHATLTPPLLLAMVYYIDRLCALYPEFTINTLTVHRFLITAATVAAKGLSDSFWNNSTYARVGGVRVAELKLLELEFLYRVDWKIVPNPDVLVAYYQGLVHRCPGYTCEPDDDEIIVDASSGGGGGGGRGADDDGNGDDGNGKGETAGNP